MCARWRRAVKCFLAWNVSTDKRISSHLARASVSVWLRYAHSQYKMQLCSCADSFVCATPQRACMQCTAHTHTLDRFHSFCERLTRDRVYLHFSRFANCHQYSKWNETKMSYCWLRTWAEANNHASLCGEQQSAEHNVLNEKWTRPRRQRRQRRRQNRISSFIYYNFVISCICLIRFSSVTVGC